MAALVFGAAPALADQWYLAPQLQTKAVANDNQTLNRNHKVGVVGGVLSPQFQFGHRGPTHDISLLGRVDLNGYAVNSRLSSVDELAQFHAGYFFERSTLSLDSAYRRDTIFDTPEDDTGQFVDDVRVTTISAAPSWSYQLSELSLLSFHFSYVDKSYEKGSGLTDYKYYSTGPQFSYKVTEVDTFLANASYGWYRPDGSSHRKSDTVDLSFGWQRDFTERLHVSASAGPSLVFEDSSSGGQSSTDLRYNVSLKGSYEFSDKGDVSLAYSRKTEPSSSGRSQNRARLSFALNYDFLEDLSFRMGASYVGKETGSDGNFRAFNIEPSLVWQLDEDLDLTASYRYREKIFENPSDSAVSNSVFLTLTYRPTEFTWSD